MITLKKLRHFAAAEQLAWDSYLASEDIMREQFSRDDGLFLPNIEYFGTLDVLLEKYDAACHPYSRTVFAELETAVESWKATGVLAENGQQTAIQVGMAWQRFTTARQEFHKALAKDEPKPKMPPSIKLLIEQQHVRPEQCA